MLLSCVRELQFPAYRLALQLGASTHSTGVLERYKLQIKEKKSVAFAYRMNVLEIVMMYTSLPGLARPLAKPLSS